MRWQSPSNNAAAILSLRPPSPIALMQNAQALSSRGA